MSYHINLEQIESHWVAYAAALPGCFASEATLEQAVAAAPGAILAYLEWRGLARPAQAPEVVVDEIHRAWFFTPDYEVNAFFAEDRPVLTPDDVTLVVQLLARTRQELLAAVDGLSKAEIDRALPGQRWPIAGVLRHVANAENWYLDRLGLGNRELRAIEDPFERLASARQGLLERLPGLAGDARVVMADGETWSPRKVTRLALWHERDHTQHIRQLRAQLKAGSDA